MDGIASIFLGMYILGRGESRDICVSFHGSLSKVMDESLKYMYICMQRHFGGNLAMHPMHLSILEVRT